MKIGVFAYNFHHLKTKEGLINLFLAGYKVKVVFAAAYKNLKIKSSKIRITPQDILMWHPHYVCKATKTKMIPNIEHNGDDCISEIKNRELDLGIILGARILSKEVIDAFRIGVLNLHPGLLPDNRGLDNIKWAIVNDMPIGVTGHLIDEQIDRGRMIMQRTIKIYKDDTLVDVYLRNMVLEQEVMLSCLMAIAGERSADKFPLVSEGRYYKPMDEVTEGSLMGAFEEYKKKWSRK